MWGVSVYAAILFFLLTPGVVVSLPPGSSLLVKAATHAVVFAVVLALTHKPVARLVGLY
jgi:hypothetical protein